MTSRAGEGGGKGLPFPLVNSSQKLKQEQDN